jgi:hypothetical protein
VPRLLRFDLDQSARNGLPLLKVSQTCFYLEVSKYWCTARDGLFDQQHADMITLLLQLHPRQ